MGHGFAGIVVANAHDDLKALAGRDRVYLAAASYADGVRRGHRATGSRRWDHELRTPPSRPDDALMAEGYDQRPAPAAPLQRRARLLGLAHRARQLPPDLGPRRLHRRPGGAAHRRRRADRWLPPHPGDPGRAPGPPRRDSQQRGPGAPTASATAAPWGAWTRTCGSCWPAASTGAAPGTTRSCERMIDAPGERAPAAGGVGVQRPRPDLRAADRRLGRRVRAERLRAL